MKVRKRKPVANEKKRKNPLRADPTRTATLRRALSNELRKRFQRLKFEITKLIVDEDAFGLKPLPGAFSLNNRWRYQSDPKKLAAFNAWLRDQVSRGLSGKGIEDLLKRYAKAGFEKGGARAFDDTKRSVRSKAAGQRQLDFYEGTRDQFLRSSFGRPVAIEKIEMLASRSYTDLQGVNEAMATKIARSLTDGLVQGKGPREIARDMADDVDGIGIARATTIARTEIVRAHAEGQLDALEQLGVEELGVMVEWTVTEDSALCYRCESMQGVVLKIEEARGMIPVHPNCLPGDSLVLSRCRIAAASKRFYDGDLVVIRTASGRELSCTPNHPVLTDRGWVPARLLNVGGNVISDGGSEWRVAVNDNGKNAPSRIHDVAESLASSGKVATSEVPVTAPDFHGDGMDGDVAVVWSNRQLPGTRDASFFNPIRQNVFVVGRMNVRGGLSSDGTKAQFGERSFPSPRGVMCSSNLPFSLGRSHLRPLERFGLALRPSLHSGTSEARRYYSPRNTVPFGESEFRFASKVGINQIGYRDEGPYSRTIVIPENSDDDLVRDAILASKLSSGTACEVFRDQIVSKVIKHFSGHVFNLETEEGWYSAQGIITHNCRCAFVPANIGEDDSGQKKTKSSIDAAVRRSKSKEGDDWGPEVEISVDRPVSVLNTAWDRLIGDSPDFDEHLYKLYGDDALSPELLEFSRFLANAFCPTGPGGGVDPTCSPKDGGEATDVDFSPVAVKRLVIDNSKACLPKEFANASDKEILQALHSVTGAPKNWKTRVISTKDGVMIESDAPYGPEVGGYAKRELKKADDGKIVCVNHYLGAPGGVGGRRDTGKGWGTRTFVNQVDNLTKLGVSRIETYAARSGAHNGHITWAKLGYDASIILSPIQAVLLPRGYFAGTLQGLMRQDGGPQLWEKFGHSMEMRFDLTPGSLNRRVLNAYSLRKIGRGLTVNKNPANGDSYNIDAGGPELDAEDHKILDDIWQEMRKDPKPFNTPEEEAILQEMARKFKEGKI